LWSRGLIIMLVVEIDKEGLEEEGEHPMQ